MTANTALLIIDMQAAMATHPPAHDLDGTIARLNGEIRAMRAQGAPVIFIQHDEAGTDFAVDAPGGAILPDLDRQADDRVVVKHSCDSFRHTGLEAFLREKGIAHLVIGGFAVEFCVDTTVRSAAGRDYQVSILSDGTTTRDRPHISAAALIAHCNWLWANFSNEGAPLRLRPCRDNAA